MGRGGGTVWGSGNRRHWGRGGIRGRPRREAVGIGPPCLNAKRHARGAHAGWPGMVVRREGGFLWAVGPGNGARNGSGSTRHGAAGRDGGGGGPWPLAGSPPPHPPTPPTHHHQRPPGRRPPAPAPCRRHPFPESKNPKFSSTSPPAPPPTLVGGSRVAGDSLHLVGRSCEPEGVLEQERQEGGKGGGGWARWSPHPPARRWPPRLCHHPSCGLTGSQQGAGKLGLACCHRRPAFWGPVLVAGPFFFFLFLPTSAPHFPPRNSCAPLRMEIGEEGVVAAATCLRPTEAGGALGCEGARRCPPSAVPPHLPWTSPSPSPGPLHPHPPPRPQGPPPPWSRRHSSGWAGHRPQGRRGITPAGRGREPRGQHGPHLIRLHRRGRRRGAPHFATQGRRDGPGAGGGEGWWPC